MATAGLGTITATPNIAGNRRFRSYLNQSQATTGRTPSPATLDQIIQSELDAMGRRVQEQQRFGLEQSKFEELKREFDIDQINKMDTADKLRKNSLASETINAGLYGAGIRALTMEKGTPFFGGLFGGTSPAGAGAGVTNTAAGMGKGLVSGGAAPFTANPALASTATEIGGAAPVLTQAGETGLATAAIPAAAETSLASSTALPGAVGGAEASTVGTLLDPTLVGGAEAVELPAAGVGLSSLAGPAAAGFAAPGLTNLIGKNIGGFSNPTETIGKNLSLGLIKNEKSADMFGSAAVGAGAGFAIGGPPGAVIGGVAGLISGWF